MYVPFFWALTAMAQAVMPGFFREEALSGASVLTLTHISAQQAEARVNDANIAGLQLVVPNQRSNQLVLAGTPQSLRVAKSVISKTEQKPGLVVKKFPISHQDARWLVTSIGEISGIKKLIFDPTDNCVIAQGTIPGLEKLAKRIAELDRKG